MRMDLREMSWGVGVGSSGSVWGRWGSEEDDDEPLGFGATELVSSLCDEFVKLILVIT
jgi:hypothetical protein